MITRRQFIKTTAGAAGALAASGLLRPGRANAFYQSPGIPLFGTSLRSIDTIPVAAPDLTPAPVTGVTHYTINISQFADQIVPSSSGLGPTTLWGYHPTRLLAGSPTQKHLGGIIVGQKGKPIQITFTNLLNVAQHIIPVDTTLPGANQQVNRTAVHLHGGLVPWVSDGGPFDWFNFQGQHGLSFLNNTVLNPSAARNAAEYYYPLNQSARFMWYHDHAVGITRLNAYAGVASAMLIRDGFETNLINQGLPSFIEAGGNEIPLVFQDKIFVGSNIKQADPSWGNIYLQSATKNPGSLWYAHIYEPDRWELAPDGLTLPNPSCIPEFFGDTMLVNGTAFPQVTVEARRYRLRLLNACNARFLNLQLYVAGQSPNGITLDRFGNPTNTPFVNAATGKPTWLQIGTEGGFLASPAEVPSNVPLQFVVPPNPDTGQTDPSPSNFFRSLLVAPAERPDVIVDFSLYGPGTSIVLYSDAPAPFPSGDDRNDYFPGWNLGAGADGVGNPANTNHDGFGPNTRVLMRFNVVAATGTADSKLKIGKNTPLTAGLDPFIIDPATLKRGVPAPPGTPARFLTLNETFDAYGRLIQILGDSQAPNGSPYDGTANYLGGPSGGVGSTEQNVAAGSTEVWEIYNTTGDVHPMHFHLVNVQLINRQLFGGDPSSPVFMGPIIPPADNELGWKETVPMYPGTVTRLIMKFDVSQAQIRTAQGAVIPTPNSPRTGGLEYVWHCHILEHEEHDMMHALVVT